MTTSLPERFYRSLYRIRRVEEEIVRVYPSDVIKSPVHLSIGQEAVSVGVCEALEPNDVVFGTYRGHAMYLAKGGDLRRMVAELYGKVTGCARGKGGSMHLIDVSAGVMGTSAVVATTIPHAVGHAYAFSLRRDPSVVVSFFGDGGIEEGAFHESLNFAALKKLPIMFICENNLYAIHSHQLARQANPDIRERAAAYGLPAERIEGNDIFKIHELAREAAREIRSSGKGPWFLECMTYRWKEHVGPGDDFDAGYRSRSEAEPWVERDAIKVTGELLEDRVRCAIEDEVETEIRKAFGFAKRSPFPPEEELYGDVFAGV